MILTRLQMISPYFYFMKIG